VCVWKSHFAGEFHALRVEFTLVRVKVSLRVEITLVCVSKLHSFLWKSLQIKIIIGLIVITLCVVRTLRVKITLVRVKSTLVHAEITLVRVEITLVCGN
jgi:hypothetical protein